MRGNQGRGLNGRQWDKPNVIVKPPTSLIFLRKKRNTTKLGMSNNNNTNIYKVFINASHCSKYFSQILSHFFLTKIQWGRNHFFLRFIVGEAGEIMSFTQGHTAC